MHRGWIYRTLSLLYNSAYTSSQCAHYCRRQLALTPMVPRRSLEFIASSAVVAVKNLGANESTELVVSDPENGSIACQPQLESFHQSTEEVTTATSVKEMTGP